MKGVSRSLPPSPPHAVVPRQLGYGGVHRGEHASWVGVGPGPLVEQQLSSPLADARLWIGGGVKGVKLGLE